MLKPKKEFCTSRIKGGPVIKDTLYPDCDNVLKCVCVAFNYQPILRLLTGQTLPPQAEEFLKTRGQGGPIGFKAINNIALVAEVFVFPLLQSPHDVARIFRTCQLHTAWDFLHENGGSERQAACHALAPNPTSIAKQ